MTIRFDLPGQLKSGKNGMQVTRSGHHYPKPEWAAWRDSMLLYVRRQYSGPTINAACKMSVEYWAGDKRRRDVPGMADAIFHVLERGNIVRDDSLITDVVWTFRGLDRENPRAVVMLDAL